MRFYETHYDDYDNSVKLCNFHEPFPPIFQNYIFYGSAGVGKYSQMIHLIKNFSPSGLKFENKIFTNIEKQSFYINISDIHYEVDMSLLGCNSKIIWHDIYTQIIDIVALKPHKRGFIVCKNFHETHNELLEIFYSYMNVLALRSSMIQRKFPSATPSPSVGCPTQGHAPKTNFTQQIHTDIDVKFIILTEHISFIPNNILNKCKIQSFQRPTVKSVTTGFGVQKPKFNKERMTAILKKMVEETGDETETLPPSISNLKELYSYSLMESTKDIPKDNFVIICDNIIEEIDGMVESLVNERIAGVGKGIEVNMKEETNTCIFENYPRFRDIMYDILVYNLEPLEAVRYILFHYLKKGGGNQIKDSIVDELLDKLSIFMFQYGNNYRSFFHLEYFLFFLVISLKKNKCMKESPEQTA
jgi:hypothetical protein